jgi:hypothetical protein
MKQKNALQLLGVAISGLLLFSSCVKNPPADCNDAKPTVDVFATGLNNPRGLKFGPDGYLYVAEGGKGGTNSTVGKCTQIPSPLGPALGSPKGGRISRINAGTGNRTTVVDNLPTTVNQFGDVSGVADVAFIGNTLYALETGAGCSHGVPSMPNGIYRINGNGSHTLVANLSDWLQGHPVAHPEEDDFEPDGDWYSMIVVNGDFYAVEANHGELDKVTTSGDVSRIVDVSATQGHIVPTVIAYHKGEYYLGNLDTFPAPKGGSKIFKVTSDGQLKLWASGFNTILGLAFDNQDQLYVLESSVGFAFPTPGAGKIIRISTSGARDEIVSGLTFPTGLTYGPDGKLYVSNIGYGPDAIGGGQVLRVNLRTCDCNSDYSTALK